jgi:hypothetical protein
MNYAEAAICSLHGAWDAEKSGDGCPGCIRACAAAMNPGPTVAERIATALERIADALERHYRPDSPEIR